MKERDEWKCPKCPAFYWYAAEVCQNPECGKAVPLLVKKNRKPATNRRGNKRKSQKKLVYSRK